MRYTRVLHAFNLPFDIKIVLHNYTLTLLAKDGTTVPWPTTNKGQRTEYIFSSPIATSRSSTTPVVVNTGAQKIVSLLYVSILTQDVRTNETMLKSGRIARPWVILLEKLSSLTA